MPTNLIFTHNLAQALYQWADICLQSNRADRTVTYGRPYGGRSTPTPTFIDALEDAPTFLLYCSVTVTPAALHYTSHVPTS